jgi:FAD/FMN-containing dehydrogenase
MSDPIVSDLAAGVKGRVVAGTFETDFGEVEWCCPRAVVEATCVEDVVHVLRVSRSCGAPVVPRGAGHSVAGQTLRDRAIVLSNRSDLADCVVLPDGSVDVSGRTTWRALEAFLNARGRTAPVLTDYLGLTIGGTLAVGGYGFRSVSSGAQVDHVQRMLLVLPDGSQRLAEPGDELFRFGLATLGAVGIIERVVLRTIPYRPVRRIVITTATSWRALGGVLPTLADEPLDAFWAAEVRVGPGQRILVHRAVDVPEHEARGPLPLGLVGYAARSIDVLDHASESSVKRMEMLASLADRRKLWADVLVDASGLDAAMAELDTIRAEGVLANADLIIYVVAIRAGLGSVELPFAPHSGGLGPLRFGIGIYCFPRPDQVETIRPPLQQWAAKALAAGARPYRYGCIEVGAERSACLYGDAWERLRALRRELDPQELFNPGGWLRP